MNSLAFQYRGARACHLLHAEELALFLATWRRAVSAGVPLPLSRNPSYASLDALLHHVLRYAEWHMVWITRSLEIEEPDLPACPDLDLVRAQADRYVEALAASWGAAIADVEPSRFSECYVVPWGVTFSIDSMLEHAVMHVRRHRFQMEEWLAGTPS